MAKDAINQVALTGYITYPPVYGASLKNRFYLRFDLEFRAQFVDEYQGEYFSDKQKITATLWDDRAKTLSKLLRKGNKVLVIGVLHINPYRGESAYEIYAKDVHILERNRPKVNRLWSRN